MISEYPFNCDAYASSSRQRIKATVNQNNTSHTATCQALNVARIAFIGTSFKPGDGRFACNDTFHGPFHGQTVIELL